jgi:hypothetical protein
MSAKTKITNENVAKALTKITEIIKQYRCAKEMNGEQLNNWLRELVGILFYLEKERSEYHFEFEKKVFLHTSEGDSVARAVNKSEVAIPELYMLRRIMDASYKCADAMRSNLSYLKSERNHTPNQT